MISSHAFWILLLFGVTTSLLAFQFLFPRWYSKAFNGLALESLPETFYARQAGLGKLAFISYVWTNLGKLPGLLVTALIDTAAVLFFGALLLKL